MRATNTMIPAILIVEDCKDARELYMVAFERAGFRVAGARRVDQAHALLEAVRFDLLLTDYSLPDGTGLDLIARANAKGLLDETATVMCTAQRHVLPPRDVEVLYKPVSPRVLVQTIARILDFSLEEVSSPVDEGSQGHALA